MIEVGEKTILETLKTSFLGFCFSSCFNNKGVTKDIFLFVSVLR